MSLLARNQYFRVWNGIVMLKKKKKAMKMHESLKEMKNES
jgi:hypothetical protein